MVWTSASACSNRASRRAQGTSRRPPFRRANMPSVATHASPPLPFHVVRFIAAANQRPSCTTPTARSAPTPQRPPQATGAASALVLAVAKNGPPGLCCAFSWPLLLLCCTANRRLWRSTCPDPPPLHHSHSPSSVYLFPHAARRRRPLALVCTPHGTAKAMPQTRRKAITRQRLPASPERLEPGLCTQSTSSPTQQSQQSEKEKGSLDSLTC